MQSIRINVSILNALEVGQWIEVPLTLPFMRLVESHKRNIRKCMILEHTIWLINYVKCQLKRKANIMPKFMSHHRFNIILYQCCCISNILFRISNISPWKLVYYTKIYCTDIVFTNKFNNSIVKWKLWERNKFQDESSLQR